MKIFRLFTIAAAALMLVACSEDIAQMINGGKKEFTATIAAPNSGGTRTAYNESDGDINVTWTVGDKIALVHNGVKDVVTVTAVDNTTGKATIKGYITGSPASNDNVALVYPAALVSEATGDGANYTEDNTVKGKMLTQSGIRDYIQDNLDFRKGSGKLSVSGTEVTLADPAPKFNSAIAIWKLTLQDDAATPAALAATKVTIKSGSDELASTATIAATSEVYLAVPVVDNKEITIEATVSEDTYALTKEGVTLSSGDYYQSTVKLSASVTVDLSTYAESTLSVSGNTTLTGTPANNLTIKLTGNCVMTLDGVTPADGKSITIGNANTDSHNLTLSLKGENKLSGIDLPSCNITVNEAESGAKLAVDAENNAIICYELTVSGGKVTATSTARMAVNGKVTVSGGELIAKGADDNYAINDDVTVSGGKLKVKGGDATGENQSGKAGINNNLTVSGTGAVYIAGGAKTGTGSNGSAVVGQITGAYAYDGSAWSGSNSGNQYVSTDTSKDPTSGEGEWAFLVNTVDLSKLTADYTAKNFDKLTGTLAGNYKITIADGASVTLGGISIGNSSIICEGDATITLADGSNNTITAPGTYAAIQAGGAGKKLIIKAETAGTGKLTATAGYSAAAIGSNYNASCGDIEIQGGDITANGGSLAAAIGSGNAETSDAACGTITISGGKVTANGGVNGGAGIGTGAAYEHSQTCGGISITGGTITAIGGGSNGRGAGIGTGVAKFASSNASQDCGNINISGGTVEATGGKNAAGIGTGYAWHEGTYSGKSCSQTCGTITIGTGVTSVKATKGDGSPNSIGVGNKMANDSYHTHTQTCGTITIGTDATTYAGGVAESPFVYPTPTVGGVNDLPSFSGGGGLFN